MTRVLVIDDEPHILRALRINLSVRGYEVITASTGAGALRAAAEHKPDVVILDLGLPDISGIEVLAGLRGWLSAPVIVLSARIDSADKVEALDAVLGDPLGGQIDSERFGFDNRLIHFGRRRVAADRGAQPGQELVHSKGFGDVVIGAGVQRLGDRTNSTGVGLGLAVARGFVEAMGGTVAVEDTPGGGLTFVVSLPRATP